MLGDEEGCVAIDGLCTSNLIAYSESGIIKDICLSTITQPGKQ